MISRVKKSFQFRLFAALLVIILIFIPGTGYFSYLQARRAIEIQMQYYAVETATQIAERIKQFLSQHMDIARLIKATIENKMLDRYNQNALINYFYMLKNDHQEFVNVYYGDEQGQFTMVPPQAPEIYKIFDPRSRPWYEEAKSSMGENWTNVYLFASTQKPGITASIPVMNKEGAVIGVCGIDIDLSTFSKFIEGIKIEAQGYAYVIENKYGRVIAHPDLAQKTWEPEHIELLSSCLRDLKAAGKQAGITLFHDEYFLTAYTNYPENNWTVGVTLPMTQFLSYIQNIKKATITLVLVAMVLCSILSYVLTLTIYGPLHGLRLGIQRVSSGDLNYNVAPPGIDIADALADSFNHMAASLRVSQKKLERTNIELVEKEKMAVLGQMTASIAHELKNPLGVILGSAQVVANKSRSIGMREEAANFIIDEIERLNKTLKSFLAFSKPAPPSLSQCNLNQLLEETLAVTESQLARQGIVVKKTITNSNELCLADKDQIRQVFWNIIFNAVQAMGDRGSLVVISKYRDIKICDDPDSESCIEFGPTRELTIEFSDSGTGMSQEEKERIFEPFVSYRAGGVGLGLSIVHQILKLHHASIEVKSKKNEGTTFTIIFPCVRKNEKKTYKSIVG